MANSLGTLSAAIIAHRTIDYLKEMFPPILRLFLDFTDQRVKFNQSLTTRIPGASAAYDASTGYTAQDVTDTDKSVTANEFRATSLKFTVAEMSKTGRNLVDEHAVAAANSLGKDLMDKFFAKITIAAFANETHEQNANYDDDTIRAMRRALGDRDNPLFGRVGILNSAAWEALTGSSSVMTLDSNPAAHDQFRTAPAHFQMHGFDLFEYPAMPTNSEDLNGVFMTPGALIGVTGVPRDANEAGFPSAAPATALVTVETDPDTGISLLTRESRLQNGDFQVDLAWIFGFAAGDPARLQRTQNAA
jgi:hypothetical protein